MIPPDLLEIMRCPETHQHLSIAEPSLVEKINEDITARQLRNRAGKLIEEKIEAGLVRADRKYLYPVRQNIPIMLVDEAIPLPALGPDPTGFPGRSS